MRTLYKVKLQLKKVQERQKKAYKTIKALNKLVTY